MIDLRKSIEAKSDQLNADDLFGAPITVTVAKVSLLADEQPVAVHYEGDSGKPYKPCKSMRRVLVNCWGTDGNAYAGRSMTLYRDEKVIFGGAAVGGIRISHLSHIDAPITMSLTATKKSKKPFTVQPLGEAPKPKPDADDKLAAATVKAEAIVAEITADPANAHIVLAREKAVIARLRNGYPALLKIIDDVTPTPTGEEELPL